LVNALPLKTSRTTAREITTPAEAVNPCKKRAPIKTVIFGASAHKSEAPANKGRATRSGLFRPKESLSGPKMNGPKASPSKQAVKLVCTSVAGVSISEAMPGKLGKYM